MEQKCIMAIGGHVGDAELTCGGVLASLSLEGYDSDSKNLQEWIH